MSYKWSGENIALNMEREAAGKFSHGKDNWPTYGTGRLRNTGVLLCAFVSTPSTLSVHWTLDGKRIKRDEAAVLIAEAMQRKLG